jgi:hypothetical protein
MMKIWAFVIVIFAIVIAILAISLSQAALRPIFIITTFFDVMIPILGVGALVKYLCCCHSNCCDKKD